MRLVYPVCCFLITTVAIGTFRLENASAETPFKIVINEIMQNPAAVGDTEGEWFELYNAGDASVDLNGFVVRDDDSDAFVIDTPLVLAPGGFAVLGNNADIETNGGVRVDFSYGSSMFLANGADELVLVDRDGLEADRVAWDGGSVFPDPTGASMALVDPNADNAIGLNWTVSSPAFGGGDRGTPGADNSGQVADAVAVLISEVQGSGTSSPLLGQRVVVEGIVVGDFQRGIGRDGELNGFAMQEEDGDSDGDPTSSEGIFVFEGDTPTSDVSRGDRVRVTGSVSEFFGETQIGDATVELLSTGETLPSAAVLSLPFDAVVANSDGELIADLEAFEGMQVTVPQPLFVTELFNLDRFGEIRLAADGRLFQFTNDNPPDMEGFARHVEEVARSTIMLDDGLNVQNPDPIRYPAPGLTTSNAVRMGDSVMSLRGVLRFTRGSGGSGDELYRVVPTEEPAFESQNVRPQAPQVEGSLTVASFNVLNFFNDIDDSTGRCFPSLTDEDCRGADNIEELERQQAKLVVALSELDADIIGLVELENDYVDGAQSSIATLVDALNAAGTADCGAYDYVDPNRRVGDDAIAVGLVFCADTVSLAAGTTPAILTDALLPELGLVDRAPIFDGESTNRAPLAATFDVAGEQLTVVVNHFKSKGPSSLADSPVCDAPAAEPNCDQGDGQGFWNARRIDAAVALLAWLAGSPTGSDDPDRLIIGDLNAYQREDPIATLLARGFTDAVLAFGTSDEQPYSFVFDGQAGALDFALVSPSLVAQTRGAAEWHSNADEADGLDYNTDFGRNVSIFDGAVPFRASDHDPLVVGFDLGASSVAPTFADVASQVSMLVASGELVGAGRYSVFRAIRLGWFEQLLDWAVGFEERGLTDAVCGVSQLLVSGSDGGGSPPDLVEGPALSAVQVALLDAQAASDCGG
ncbi:MAG: ExeM/NucH family extracellular endonuclease [Myxococcota bacterium]